MLVNIQFSAHSGENAHGEAAHPVIDLIQSDLRNYLEKQLRNVHNHATLHIIYVQFLLTYLNQSATYVNFSVYLGFVKIC